MQITIFFILPIHKKTIFFIVPKEWLYNGQSFSAPSSLSATRGHHLLDLRPYAYTIPMEMARRFFLEIMHFCIALIVISKHAKNSIKIKSEIKKFNFFKEI